MTYEKPEHPPPRIPSRSAASIVPRFFIWRAMASTALGVTEMLASIRLTRSCSLAYLLPWLLGRHAPVGLLLAVVGDGALDGILRQHRAVDLHGRQVELLDDLGVLDRLGLVDRLALDPLGGQRGAGDGGAAAEGLELGVLDDALVVDLDLQAHHVA